MVTVPYKMVGLERMLNYMGVLDYRGFTVTDYRDCWIIECSFVQASIVAVPQNVGECWIIEVLDYTSYSIPCWRPLECWMYYVLCIYSSVVKVFVSHRSNF